MAPRYPKMAINEYGKLIFPALLANRWCFLTSRWPSIVQVASDLQSWWWAKGSLEAASSSTGHWEGITCPRGMLEICPWFIWYGFQKPVKSQVYQHCPLDNWLFLGVPRFRHTLWGKKCASLQSNNYIDIHRLYIIICIYIYMYNIYIIYICMHHYIYIIIYIWVILGYWLSSHLQQNSCQSRSAFSCIFQFFHIFPAQKIRGQTINPFRCLVEEVQQANLRQDSAQEGSVFMVLMMTDVGVTWCYTVQKKGSFGCSDFVLRPVCVCAW